jgi:hypothetical protein
VIKPFRTIRRMVANSDRATELLEQLATDGNKNAELLRRIAEHGAGNSEALSATVSQLDRIFQNLENQATASNLRLDYVREGLDKQISQFERIIEESRAANLRVDRLVAAARAQGRLLHRAVNEGLVSYANAAPEMGSSDITLARAGSASTKQRPHLPTNDLVVHQNMLDQLKPWAGEVPKGYLVDFLGVFTDANFRRQFGADPARVGGAYVKTEIPRLAGGNGEWWFETADWLAAAYEASGRFVMITLGACYGAQAVGAYRALQLINPMPCKLVAVEPEPENFRWLRQHLSDNGIDPSEHWLVHMAISEDNNPVFFPIGAAGSGANNCIATNDPGERRLFLNETISAGRAAEVLSDIVLENSVRTSTVTLPGEEEPARMKLVSSVTVKDLIDPFDLVDYLEADIQQSEVLVFPAFIDDLREKVRRIHIGTHGAYNHQMLRKLFTDSGWEVVFDYGPDGKYDSPLGQFETCDGVLTVRNPDL